MTPTLTPTPKPKHEILSAQLLIFPGTPHGMRLEWTTKNGWFGTIDFLAAENGEISMYTECMGKEFVKEIMNYVIDNAKVKE
jgi:hypothetical protein